eukprot:m.162436 g.162436  ORF g.162436 m.162436 type:complete len:525 (+) comp17087_c1_seq1:37-1611(+)
MLRTASVAAMSRRFGTAASTLLQRASTPVSKRRVNDIYQPGIPIAPCPKVAASCTHNPCVCSPSSKKEQAKILADHRREWPHAESIDAHKNHSLFTWTAHDVASAGAITAVRAEGIYFWDQNGKRYIDWNSMAMCSNHGHTPDQSIIDAVVEQMKSIPYAYPGAFVTPVRGRLCKLLADICPGDINTFMFPSSGAEANEIALRMARLYTGRHKVMTRYRSYHGATTSTLSMTGDHRRWPAENGATGHLKFFDPYPYGFSHGKTEEEITENSLAMLREQISYEGGHTIASIHIESITGTNGVLKPPKGYLEGIREICNTHGILMVCDEVMAGFGRTGKLFGFCHAPSVVPDIITFAKGLNGAFLPLGGVGVRDHIAAHFRKNNVAIGSTYNSHPVALASAYAAVQHFLEEDLTGNAARMEKHLQAGLNYLMDRHPSIKQARCVGLFGCFDVQKNTKGDFIARVFDPLPAPMIKFKKTLLENGLFTMMRGHTVFCNPPLIITEAQIKEAIDVLDKSLPVLDEAMEK